MPLPRLWNFIQTPSWNLTICSSESNSEGCCDQYRRAVGSPTAACPHSVLHQASFSVFNLTSRYHLHAFSCLCVRDDCIFSVITQFSINLLFLNPCTVINQVCTWQWLTNQYKLFWHCWTWRRHFLFSMGCKQHLIFFFFWLVLIQHIKIHLQWARLLMLHINRAVKTFWFSLPNFFF